MNGFEHGVPSQMRFEQTQRNLIRDNRVARCAALSALLVALALLAGCGNGGDGGGDAAPADGRSSDAMSTPDAADAGSACVALAQNGCPESQPPTSQTAGCDYGCNAASNGLSCVYSTARCNCGGGSGYSWTCESASCPATKPADGTACTEAELTCGAEFEDPGVRCIPGDLVWTQCSYASRGPTGPGAQCPPTAPAVGDRCCVLDAGGGAPRQCMYPGEDGGVVNWDCVNYHWAIVAP